MRVLSIGETMAELAPTERPGDYRLGFAGDTFNTAWYLARCATDLSVSYLTVVGDDAISRDLTSFMRSSGIDDTYVRTSPDRTIGLYMISLKNGERSFSYWRGQSAARNLANDRAYLDDAMSAADLIYFSGITLAILDPEEREVFLAALNSARLNGKTIAFDPNLRPQLWPSSTTMTSTIMQGAAVSDLVLPSFEDEADWFDDACPNATAARYAEAGAITVVVKNGPLPVIYFEGEVRREVPVTPVDQLVDSTAAGDSFNAGIIAGHALGLSLASGISFACALSREVVQQKGALVEVNPLDICV